MSSTKPKYVLTYFNVRGLAEPLRLLFAYGNIEYKDVRISFEEWPSIKPTMPLGQMPVLDIDGVRTYQSNAMIRYIAKSVGLVGKTDWENFQIDMAVDTIDDLRLRTAFAYYETDAATKEVKMEKIKSETVPFYSKKLDEMVAANGGYFAGGKLTWADIFFVGIIDYLNFLIGFNLMENHPNLQAVHDKVTSIAEIKKWIQIRPVTDR